MVDGVNDPGDGMSYYMVPLVARYSFKTTVNVIVDDEDTVVGVTDMNSLFIAVAAFAKESI